VPSLEKNATIQPAIADFIYLFYYHPFYFKDSENPIVNSDYNPFVLKCDHDENLIKIGLVIGSAVVNYQMSLLEWERNLILDEIDLNSRMEHDCKVDLRTFGDNTEKSEQVEQSYRDRDNLKLDIDIIKQLKVNLEAKIKRYKAIKIG